MNPDDTQNPTTPAVDPNAGGTPVTPPADQPVQTPTTPPATPEPVVETPETPAEQPGVPAPTTPIEGSDQGGTPPATPAA